SSSGWKPVRSSAPMAVRKGQWSGSRRASGPHSRWGEGDTMKAVCWAGPRKVEVREVPDPRILNARDVIVKVTSTAICGSDLHLYDHYIPTMRDGDVLGHEFMGEVVEVGPEVATLRVGDRVVVPFPIACGDCGACARGLFSVCENANPNAGLSEKLWGHTGGAIYGYSHLMGGYAGGQAEYVRVPFADVGPIRVDDDLTDAQVLLLSDVLPTGYMGAELCHIQPGDVVAVWGAGVVGLFAALSAQLLGAWRVVVIDRLPYRLALARDHLGVDTHNYEEGDVKEALNELTGGRGPDACIDAVGRSEEHTSELQSRENLVCRLLLEKKNIERELVIVHFAQYDCNGEFLRYTRLGGDCHVPPV